MAEKSHTGGFLFFTFVARMDNEGGLFMTQNEIGRIQPNQAQPASISNGNTEVANENVRPPLVLITNDDTIGIKQLALCIYAKNMNDLFLPAIKALYVMVMNTNRPLSDIATDSSVFESLDPNSTHHKYLSVSHDDPGFQICLRSVRRMMSGQLSDNIIGATRFHREELLPDWSDIHRKRRRAREPVILFIDQNVSYFFPSPATSWHPFASEGDLRSAI